ncbi:myeloperoxidase-like [Pecten maximus]|uniref:myeloperoxidase-like n=1 Tax=Pecten maximus TaxID=6579 RepID=UPI0014590CD3|nr:myeloperoxidase-like [Pecten maximus]
MAATLKNTFQDSSQVVNETATTINKIANINNNIKKDRQQQLSKAISPPTAAATTTATPYVWVVVEKGILVDETIEERRREMTEEFENCIRKLECLLSVECKESPVQNIVKESLTDQLPHTGRRHEYNKFGDTGKKNNKKTSEMAPVLSLLLLLVMSAVIHARETARSRIKREDNELSPLYEAQDDIELSRKERGATMDMSSSSSTMGTMDMSSSTMMTNVYGGSMEFTLSSAVLVGTSELNKDIQQNQNFLVSGVDSDDDSVYSHQLDMFAAPSSVSGAMNKCAYLELLLVQEIHRITKTNVDQLLYNSSWQAALKALLAKYCAPQHVPICDANSRFRTIDGSCNNLKHPRWGMSFRAQRRYRQPAYQDGISTPRKKSVTFNDLPSPRVISNKVFKAGPKSELSAGITSMHMSFGQFLDHDFIFTPVIKGEGGAGINCCASMTTAKRPECFPIIVPQSDKDIKESCMNFVRSSAAVEDRLRGYRDQLNEVTSYLDASNVYGSTKKKMLELRDSVKKRGLLKVDSYNRLPVGKTACFKDTSDDYCQDAGDKRVNVVPNLGAVHLLWVREHNRVVKILANHNPTWDDNRLFYEGRKIIIAMMQHIVYNEYLPIILNSTYLYNLKLQLRPLGYSYYYRDNIDATVSNVFGAAAFRFGHSQITNIQAQYSPSHVPTKTVPIEKTFHRPHLCEEMKGNGYEGVLRWLSNAKATKSDRFFEVGIRNKLFPDPKGNTMDLPAINVNRGRDHGIPAYNVWREWCGLPKAKTFQAGVSFGLLHHTKEAAAALQSAYSHPEDIDLYAGAMSETAIKNGIVGPTFACIIGYQFQQLKLGDRFWYEYNLGRRGLNPAQLSEIRKSSLAKIICNNIQVTKMQPKAFQTVSTTNARIDCSKIPDVNLAFWNTDQQCSA